MRHQTARCEPPRREDSLADQLAQRATREGVPPMKILLWALAVLAAAVAGIALLNLDDIRRYQRMHRM